MSDHAIFSAHVQKIKELARQAIDAATGNTCAVPLQGLSLMAAESVAVELRRTGKNAVVRNNKLVIDW